jgi:hypothetical protein
MFINYNGCLYEVLSFNTSLTASLCHNIDDNTYLYINYDYVKELI